MFMKKVLVISLLSLSISSFAKQVAPGVEQIYEYETVTGEDAISGRHITENESGSFFFSNLLTAQTQQYSGFVRQNIFMRGSHYFSIVNQTQSVKSYRIRTWLCTNTNACSDWQSGYNLNPGARYTQRAGTELTANFPTSGLYSLTAATVISDGENNQASDSKYITIS
jgi:hypothetical protein